MVCWIRVVCPKSSGCLLKAWWCFITTSRTPCTWSAGVKSSSPILSSSHQDCSAGSSSAPCFTSNCWEADREVSTKSSGWTLKRVATAWYFLRSTGESPTFSNRMGTCPRDTVTRLLAARMGRSSSAGRGSTIAW
ncbi:hypothetical protein GDO81_019836 [Engystomops pustulosus]|uniref:Secreted protein n=1 Tax=Engystomops pustulosus TaxID=76066 RepID=A0AAV6YYB6_ENGPU|nr:hypothetical protein GDO81_019836 [Engystomops pustulosus]